MDEGSIGIVVLGGISVAVAAAAHALSARYWRASIISGLVSIAAFLALVIARNDAGPFIAIAAVVGAVYGVVIALIVGLPFRWVRSRRRPAP